MKEYIKEILSSMKAHKTRSILTGFGIIWGMFILILLLGMGKGFQEGILQLFSSFAKNSIFIYGGSVSDDKLTEHIQHKRILFNDFDIKIIKDRYPEIESISPELSLGGNLLTSYKENTYYPQIKGVLADYFNVRIIKPKKGRLLNALDNNEARRVALIGQQVADILFADENPIGKAINISNSFFTVVGIIEKGSVFTQNEQNSVYMPYNTFKECIEQTEEYNAIVLTLSRETDATIFENELKTFFSKKKGFDINDKRAIYILNFENQVKAFDNLFKGINLFLWLIGLCLLLSGIVGISNIMLVVVKERTFEIGIRKAIGAESKSIIWMIITESIVITSIAGILGLLLGGSVIGIINWIVASFIKDSSSLFTKASINYTIIIFSMFVLILSGVIAGFFPAKKASAIIPVQAIRNKN